MPVSRSRQIVVISAAVALIATLILAGRFLPATVAQDQPGGPAVKQGAAAEPMPPTENPFPGRFPAPSLDGGVEWFNTASEISIKDLRGKIVIFDFWTYCCINCLHVLPDLKFLEQKYANQLVVIGVHAPKFDNEKDSDNIREAILRYEVEHPVVNDADMVIARKYHFSSWPTLVLVDPEGNYVGQQPGEGNRELFDTVISRMIDYHRAKGTLDETPVRFDLEREKAKPTPLRFPGKVLADEASDRLFISDSNHNRIVVASLAGELIDVIGCGAIGSDDGPYAAATFDHPQGMCLVGRTLYVADTENHLIRSVDLAHKTVSTLAGTGEQSRGRLPGGLLRDLSLNSPWDLLHLEGVLYIAMAGPHQLWQHKLGTETIEVFAGTGREDIIDGPLDYCALAQPSGLTTDGTALYEVCSEGSAVRKVTRGKEGEIVTLAGPRDFPQGRALFEFGDIDGAGERARLQHPLGIVYHDGALYVADTYNHKIKRVDPKTGACRTWLGTGKPGTALKPAQLSEPSGLAVAGGKLIIADTNNHRLLATDLETRQTVELPIKGLPPPQPAPKSAPPAETTPAVEVAKQTVRPGSTLGFTIAFELPEGFKLNKLAPVTYTLAAADGPPLVAAGKLNVRAEANVTESEAAFDVPLVAKSGGGTIDVTLSYSFCRDGTGGVCRFAKQRWRVPVEIAANAADAGLKLTAAPGR
jgi:thiol-disulfide isomerase/thioredoxin